MGEQILAMTMMIVGAGEEDQPLLEALCGAAETAWSARLRDGMTAEACSAAFCSAAAFTAAADFLVSRFGGGVKEFTAGEISVKNRDGSDAAELASALRQTAERLMEPYAVEAGFAFQGVRG